MDRVSLLGYSRMSPYQNNPFLDIMTETGLIDMSKTDKDLMGIDNTGQMKHMKARSKKPYKFAGNIVREIPMDQLANMQQGGKMTTADSLALYNDTLTLQKYYSKYKKTSDMKIPVIAKDFEDYMEAGRNDLIDMINTKFYPTTNRGANDKNIKFEEYYKKINHNKFEQREFLNSILDLRAPMALYDKRLLPNRSVEYRNHIPNDPLVGDVVDIPMYDTMQVKPYHLLTDKEKFLRYGIKPTPEKQMKSANPVDTVSNRSSAMIQGRGYKPQDLSQKATEFSFTFPTFQGGHSQKTIYFNSKKELDNFTKSNAAGVSSQETSDYKTATGYVKELQTGGYFQKMLDYLFEEDQPIQQQTQDLVDSKPDENTKMDMGLLQNEEENLAKSILFSSPMERRQRRAVNSSVGNKAQYAYNFFKEKGLADHQAAGVVANLIQESGNFRDDVISGEVTGDNNLKDKAYGIAQWRGDRYKNLINYSKEQGLNPYSLDAQLMFVEHEAKQRGDWKKLLNTTNLSDATHSFNYNFEVSADSRNPKLRNYRTKHVLDKSGNLIFE